MATMLIREDEEPLSQVPTLFLDVDEMREGDVIVNWMVKWMTPSKTSPKERSTPLAD
jgi:hypothetical protein